MTHRVMLLAAGRGVRFLPVAERISKPLFPFLNVPLIRTDLPRLRRQGLLEAGVNLHHLGQQIQSHLLDRPADLPKLCFFPEPEILGTAGALRNAAAWLSDGDFLVVNTGTVVETDFPALVSRHRQTGRAAALLSVENRNPDRYTPLQAEGDRITGFGGRSPRLWQPSLAEGKKEIGWVLHEGPFSDLGRPSDFLNATLEALECGGPLGEEAGSFDADHQILFRKRLRGFQAVKSILGAVSVGDGASIEQSAVWDAVEIGDGAEIRGCLVADG